MTSCTAPWQRSVSAVSTYTVECVAMSDATGLRVLSVYSTVYSRNYLQSEKLMLWTVTVHNINFSERILL